MQGLFAHVAQLVEHFLGKEEVMGSIPIIGSNLNLSAAFSCRVVENPSCDIFYYFLTSCLHRGASTEICDSWLF